MSEGFNAPESRPRESFANKKNAVITHLKTKIEREKTSLESLVEKYRNNDRKTREALGPIPDEVWRDGGSDLSEWRAQVGADAHDREHGDEEDRERMETLSREIDDLERDLTYIQTIQSEEEAQQDDARIFERYLIEVSKLKA